MRQQIGCLTHKHNFPCATVFTAIAAITLQLVLINLTWCVDVDTLFRGFDEFHVCVYGGIWREEGGHCAGIDTIRGLKASVVGRRLVVVAVIASRCCTVEKCTHHCKNQAMRQSSSHHFAPLGYRPSCYWLGCSSECVGGYFNRSESLSCSRGFETCGVWRQR